MLLPKVTTAGIAYGTIMFCSSFMHNIFITYYVDLFTNVVRVDPLWFYLGQFIFMLWNAANDPLLGWLSDTTNCHEHAMRIFRQLVARVHQCVTSKFALPDTASLHAPLTKGYTWLTLKCHIDDECVFVSPCLPTFHRNRLAPTGKHDSCWRLLLVRCVCFRLVALGSRQQCHFFE
jgi:hypothetical protein